MQLKSFRVHKFRSIVDSGAINVDGAVTCLVGKNEAGKSALLESLYLLNPAYEESFDLDEQYPRWLLVQDRKKEDLSELCPLEATFSLDDNEIAIVNDNFGAKVLLSNKLTIKREYSGRGIWNFDWDKNVGENAVLAALPEAASRQFDTAEDFNKFITAIRQNQIDQLVEGDLQQAQEALEEIMGDSKSIWKRVVALLKPEVPTFFRFTQYSTLDGRIDFNELTAAPDGPGADSLQTARALLSLAGTDLEQLKNEDYELRKGELEAVQIDLTRQVFEYWKQNPDLEVLIDVDKETSNTGNGQTAVAKYLDIRLRDKRTGYSNNFSQRSSGFQWFFSFLAAFSEFEDSPGKNIVLLDEPALALHGKAQADFLRFINERLSTVSPVIYTTHSPFMIEASRFERVRIVEDKGPPDGSVVSDDVLVSDPDSLFPLHAALGYDISQNLFIGDDNLLVEGTSDYIYLTVLSIACKSSGRSCLSDRWRILPAGGATNIPTFVSLIGGHLDVTVFADSNAKGMQRISNMVDKGLLNAHRLILANVIEPSRKADIEDLFSTGDYLKLFNATFGSSIKVKELPEGDRIVKTIEVIHGEEYDHGLVAEQLLRNQSSLSFSDLTLDNFAKVFDAINETLSG